MKKLLTFLLLLLPLFVFAQESKLTMVRYSQDQNAVNASISIRNNTNEEIKNFRMRITYLNTNNIELDYKDIKIAEPIAPKKTKEFKIGGFGWNEGYYFYKSRRDYYGANRPFKVKTELLGYNEVENNAEQEDEFGLNRKNDAFDEGAMFFTIFIILSAIFFIFNAIPISMAQSRGRNAALWFLLSVVTTPILTIILLLILGDRKDEPMPKQTKKEENYMKNER